MDHPPAQNILPPPGKKIWRNGTLVYTSGGLAALFFLLLFGDFALAMRDRSIGPIAHWYLSHLGIPNLLFAILLSSFPAALSLILGPIISFKSDRLRSRWGRRIPFLLITTPLAALGMIGVAFTPVVAKWVHGQFPEQNPVVVAVVCFGVFWAAYEFASIAGGGVFAGLVNDVVPRELLGRFYGLFRAISLIDGMIFNYWIIGKVPEHFTLILTLIGLFYGSAFLWVCLKVKEGGYPPPPPMPEPGPGRKNGLLSGFKAGAGTYFRECFTNPYYISVFIMLMLAGLSFGPINTFAIPYANSLGVDMKVYGKYLALTFLISLCLSYFLGWLADRFHPLRMAMVMLAGYVVVTAWGAVFATTANTFLVAWVLHGVLSGCYFTTTASLGQRLYPQSRFAQFASAAGIVGALAGMVLAPSVGLLIDQTGRVYRHAFTIGCALSFTALVICVFFVYGRFKKLGGPGNYLPPE